MNVRRDRLIGNSLYECYLGDAETYQLMYANQTALDIRLETVERVVSLTV
jgi:hypothetical protein